MQEVKIFDKPEFGKIRTIVIHSEVLFFGVDVATALNYSRPSKAVTDNCKGVLTEDSIKNGGGYPEKLIKEGDVYRLIVKASEQSNSEKVREKAEEFERWIFDEVLPTIRKTGGYINNADLLVNTYFDDIPEEQKTIVKGLLQNIESKQKKITALDKENDLLAERALQWADRPLINALVRAYGRSLGGDYSTAWGDFKKELLYRHGINLNARITHYLNNTGKKTKPRTLNMLDDSELQKALSTAAALCRENSVDISDIIDKKIS